jgi:hypothetical protein
MKFEFKLGDKIYCNKKNLNGVIEEYKAGLFTIAYENGSYGRYSPQTMLKDNRFVLFEGAAKYKNVVYVDFKNKKIAG